MSQIIKKGLACCTTGKAVDCNGCPYSGQAREDDAPDCFNLLAVDALAYIETLEARLAQDAFDRMLEMKGQRHDLP